MIRRLFRLLSAIFVGLILSVWIIQNNTEVEHAIAKKIISALEQAWNVKINVKSLRVNFFTSSLYLNNGDVEYLEKKDCNWSFDQCKIHIQPLALLRKKRVNLDLKFYNVNAKSRLTDGIPDIATHIATIFSGEGYSFHVSVKSVCVNNLNLNILDALHVYSAKINGSCLVKKIRHAKRENMPNSWQADLSIKNLQFIVDGKVFIQQFSTSGSFYKNIKSASWFTSVSGLLKSFMPTPTQTYSINGVWNEDKKYVNIKNFDQTFNLDLSYLGDRVKVSGAFPVDIALQAAGFFGIKIDASSCVSGKCNLNLEWVLKNSTVDLKNISPDSTITIDNLKIKNLEFEKIGLDFKESSTEKLVATIDILHSHDFQALGLFRWNWSKFKGKIKLMNKLPIKLKKIGGYEINSKNLFITAMFDKDFNFNGDYSLNVLDSSVEKTLKYVGTFKVENNELKIKGITRKGEYQINAAILPKPSILKWLYAVNGQPLVDLKSDNSSDNLLQGSIDFAFVKSFLSQNTKHLILGRDCIFNLAVDQSDFLNFRGSLKLASGKFYIPESRNIIENFRTDFDIKVLHKIILNNLQIGFFKGEISSPKIVIQFDENSSLVNLHIPLQVKDLLINWKKDLLAIIYGNVLIKKTARSNYKASAQLIAKKSILRENILSLPEKNQSFASPMGIAFFQNNDFDFDIRLSSEQPIKAKTPALETNASINLRILYQKNKNIMRTPQLTGSIKLDSGHIKFLRTKLYFEYGKVQFISNQMNDPIIDLIARNRINKYQITLQATGSLQKPIILLESNPELTEEQILGLLLSGSEAAKLQTDLFAMLEQNLHDMILGSKAISPGATSFFEKLAKPFKYIQISPDFTNQSARGGIKGSVSVNLTDQVKAQIQKNFNLQDDFNAQVEYQISDDVSLKGSVDQRGELGAEVELRLKL